MKASFKRDWDQTKHDMGVREPDTDQHVTDTVKQAAGKEPIPPRGIPNYEFTEDAYRFGYGARAQYANEFPRWDGSLEAQLQRDWQDTYLDRDWASYCDFIRKGWDYPDKEGLRRAA